MSYSSADEALQIARNTNASSQDREGAIDFLDSHPDPEVISLLIELLETDDPGVRWRSANALAKIGKTALVPLLHALVDKSDSRWMLEGVYHVLRDNRSHEVAKMTEGLRTAMKGPGATIATISAAGELLVKLAGEGS